MPDDQQPTIVTSPRGVEVLVYEEADGTFRIAGWKHLLYVERGVLIEKLLIDPSPEIRQRRFCTIEELGEAVDREAFRS